MALGINETIATDKFKSKHLVYRDGVFVRFPNKDKNIIACILPAFADPSDKSSYVPYRDEDEPDNFSKWAIGIKMHPFVNREQNILSPQSLDPEAYDPIDELIRVAKADPEYCTIAGFGRDGKKMQNAYKSQEVRLSNKFSGFVVNAIILFDRETPPDKAVLLQIPKTAFSRPGRSSNDGSASWGLLSELNRKNRKASKNDADSFFWGDITDPRALVPCSLALTPNPAGGMSIYNMVPIEEEPVKCSRATLESRYNLDNVLYEITEGEIIDRLVFYFSDVPKLLLRAFAHRVPNLEKRLKSATAAYSLPREADEEEEDDLPAFRAAPASKAKPSREEAEDEPEESKDAARTFAPEDDDLPPPTQKRRPAKADDDNEEEGEQEVTVPVRKSTKKGMSYGELKNLMD